MLNKTAVFASKHYPDYGDSNVRWFYIVTILQNAWFQIGNWLLFALLFVSTGTFAVYEAIAFSLGILFEIPSGAFADLFGRRRTIILGAFLQAFGSLLFILGFVNPLLMFFGNILIIVSFAFRSGAQEALIYDSMKEKGVEEHFDDVRGKARSLLSLSIVGASIIGGLAWVVSPYLPWIITTLLFFIGFLATFKFNEHQVETEKVTIKTFIDQNKRGFYFLFKSNFRKYTLSFALISGSFLMWYSGIIRVLMGTGFGYSGQTINYLMAATSIIGFLVAFKFRKIRKSLGDRTGFLIVLAVSALSWLLAGVMPPSIALGFVVFLGITCAGILAELWTSIILNNHIHSKDRATAISTLSFLVQVPYVLIVVLFGKLAEDGVTELFYIAVGVLLVFGVVSYYLASKHDTQKA